MENGKREKKSNDAFRSSLVFSNNPNYFSAISNSKCDKLQQSASIMVTKFSQGQMLLQKYHLVTP